MRSSAPQQHIFRSHTPANTRSPKSSWNVDSSLTNGDFIHQRFLSGEIRFYSCKSLSPLVYDLSSRRGFTFLSKRTRLNRHVPMQITLKVRRFRLSYRDQLTQRTT